MANPTSNFGWQMPTNTDLVKDLPADFEVFGQAVDTDLADLKGGTTGQVLSKTSGTDLDFTWITPTDQTPLTTKGDLFGYSTADARIPVGTDGQVLTADSAETLGVKWAAPSAAGFVGAKATRTSSQNINNNTFTAVLWNSDIYDTDAIHDTSTNTDRFTVPSGKDGKWAITASVLWAGSSTGERRIAIYKNGSATSDDFRLSGQGSAGQTIAINSVFDLVATDYLSVYVYQESGSTLAIDSVNFCSFYYLGA
jgi:hypothetical protein